jgi:hypothetical protein
MPDSPAYESAQYAYRTYHQRRIDIADAYSRQCDENSDRLVNELAIIACEYNLAPTRVVTYAFGNSRPDFIGRVRRAISALKAPGENSGAAK